MATVVSTIISVRRHWYIQIAVFALTWLTLGFLIICLLCYPDSTAIWMQQAIPAIFAFGSLLFFSFIIIGVYCCHGEHPLLPAHDIIFRLYVGELFGLGIGLALYQKGFRLGLFHGIFILTSWTVILLWSTFYASMLHYKMQTIILKFRHDTPS